MILALLLSSMMPFMGTNPRKSHRQQHPHSANCTDGLQPLAISVNKVVKENLRKSFNV